MIQMTKKDCVMCGGSGYVTPYPYRKQKKCDHRWSRDSFMERYNATKEAIQVAITEHSIWQRALESEVKDHANNTFR